jgi:tyrosyl-tRNA synthetase
MSISDEAMWEYYRLLLLEGEEGLKQMRQAHPMATKKELAKKLTALFYGADCAEKEYQSFAKVFSQGQTPQEMDQIIVADIDIDSPSLLDALSLSNSFGSKGEIRRLFKQGAIKVNGEKMENCDYKLDGITKDGIVVKAGKKIFLKILP